MRIARIRRAHPAAVGRHGRRLRLPDRGRRQRAHRLGARREDLHQGQRRQHEAAVEAEAREHAARDAQPVRAARRRARHHRAGRARARRRRRRLRRSVRHRRRDRPSDLAPALRQHADQTGRHERHALPRRPDGGADDGADVARQVHDLRRVVGRPPAAGEPRGRQGRRAAREVHPRRRQAVRAEPAQRRHLHRHRAGLRRPDQRVLLVRPRHAARERVHPRGRRPVGTPRRGHRSPRARCSSAPATRCSIR